MTMKLLIMGAPGAGKGTVSQLITSKLTIPHISMGDLLRAHIQANDEIGQEIAPVIKEGKLVPDELTVKIINHRLAQDDAKESFLLDGYPRTRFQTEELLKVTSVSGIVVVELADEKIIERLSKRLICPTCNTVYHEVTKKPAIAGVCDVDGRALVRRPDDNPETIKGRLQTYKENTEPIIALLQEKGVPVLTIPGDYNVETQSDAVLQKIIDWQKAV